MNKVHLAIGVAMGLSLTGAAYAGDIYTIRGRCTEMLAMGHNFSTACLGKVVNANNDQGEVAFIFTLKNGAIFSFIGHGNDQVSTAAHQATQPVKEVVFSLGIQGVPDNHVPAAGTCKYGDAFAGVTHVICSASTSQGDFSAKFTTNGQRPQPGY
jgi:hypothetical protein